MRLPERWDSGQLADSCRYLFLYQDTAPHTEAPILVDQLKSCRHLCGLQRYKSTQISTATPSYPARHRVLGAPMLQTKIELPEMNTYMEPRTKRSFLVGSELRGVVVEITAPLHRPDPGTDRERKSAECRRNVGSIVRTMLSMELFGIKTCILAGRCRLDDF